MNKHEKANEEMQEVLDWSIRESEKITKRLKAEGRLFGLDGNQEEYADVDNEAKRRLKEIKEKYYP